MRPIRLILATIITFCLLFAAPAAAQFYLGVIKGEAKKIPIVVLDVFDDMSQPELRKLALEVLKTDLRRSQIFDVADPKKLDLHYSAREEPSAEAVKRGGTFGLSGA